MGSYDALRGLLDDIQACMDTECHYKTFVSLGIPPAECDSIAAWMSYQRRTEDNSECQNAYFDHAVNLTLTRCCINTDAAKEFSHASEQEDAQCFLRDIDALINCLTCESLANLESSDCGSTIGEISYDLEKEGGCYSATITLNRLVIECCSEEVES